MTAPDDVAVGANGVSVKLIVVGIAPVRSTGERPTSERLNGDGVACSLSCGAFAVRVKACRSGVVTICSTEANVVSVSEATPGVVVIGVSADGAKDVSTSVAVSGIIVES